MIKRCSGGRVYPGRDYAPLPPKRYFEWQLGQVPTVYRKESSPVARPGDEREPFGFPLVLQIQPLLWRPGSPGRDYAPLPPKRYFEWQLGQVPTVYRKESSPVARPGDEREPFGFPLILQIQPLLWRPGSPRPRLCSFCRPNVTSSGNLDRSQPYTGRRAARSQDRAMRGNHLGSLSFFQIQPRRRKK